MFLLSVVAAVLFALGGVDAAALPEVKLCYLFFGDETDLGFTFRFNIGRLETYAALKALYPRRTIRTQAWANVFAMAPAARDALKSDLVLRHGCHFILANSGVILRGADAQRWPNVTFVKLYEESGALPPNVVDVNLRRVASFFYLGVAAGLQTRSCVGLLLAHPPPFASAAAGHRFIAGVRSVNATVPLHVVTMGSWYSPRAELLAAKQLLAKGCDVIFRYSDPFDVDKYVAAETRAGRIHGVSTVGVHVPLEHFVGDTSLSSSYVSWDKVLLPVIRKVLDSPRQVFNASIHGGNSLDLEAVNSTEGVVLHPMSPLARDRVAERVEHEVQSRRGHYDLCRPHGSAPWRRLNGSASPLRPPSHPEIDGATAQCVDEAALTDYIAFDGVTYHATKAFDSGLDCPRGTRYSYTLEPTIELTCVPCPVGSYRPLSMTEAPAVCPVCPNGTESLTTGAIECTEITASGGGDDAVAAWIIAVVAGLSLCLLTAVGLAVYFIVKSWRGLRDNSAAPRDEAQPFTVVFTDIQASTALWGRLPHAMGSALDAHHDLVRGVVKKHGGYEVKTIGDAFMVVFQRPVDGVRFALDVQEVLVAWDWDGVDFESAYAALVAHGGADDTGSVESPVGPRDCGLSSVASTVAGTDALTSAAPSMSTLPTDVPTVAALRRHAKWPGLRVRCGVHHGHGKIQYDDTTKGYDYYGTVVNTAARIEGVAHGGQVLVTASVTAALSDSDLKDTAVKHLGPTPLRGVDGVTDLTQILPAALSGRVFGPLRLDQEHVPLPPGSAVAEWMVSTSRRASVTTGANGSSNPLVVPSPLAPNALGGVAASSPTGSRTASVSFDSDVYSVRSDASGRPSPGAAALPLARGYSHLARFRRSTSTDYTSDMEAILIGAPDHNPPPEPPRRPGAARNFARAEVRRAVAADADNCTAFGGAPVQRATILLEAVLRRPVRHDDGEAARLVSALALLRSAMAPLHNDRQQSLVAELAAAWRVTADAAVAQRAVESLLPSGADMASDAILLAVARRVVVALAGVSTTPEAILAGRRWPWRKPHRSALQLHDSLPL